ncbi:LUD domain-containing protein [Brevibacillus sp. SYP-B805]|uniref:LutC/YkgG family protein n=1 Tax=Brevibacillus sp. SYP-B805 TaxID=1578199 RepID=UPI0013EC2EDE|nr:lactate utilization protein [Brevibacillus sp. SYP-B805]NGQ96887.1 LUD domain-containing protein [Brevibacillus sp. SYP-B805]
MNNERNPIIERLHRQSLQQQEAFLDHIAHRLGRERITTPPARPFAGAPDFWRGFTLEAEERISLFLSNWESLGGVAKRVRSMDDARAYIADLTDRMQAKRLVCEEHPLLADLLPEGDKEREVTVWGGGDPAHLLKKAAEADIGVAVADFAIAYTGTLVLTSSPARGRSISLLPAVFIGIVRAADIRTKMGEVLSVIRTWDGGRMPAGIHFVTGPSRSADIENDLTIGVHGPGSVHALVVDEVDGR